MKHNLVPSLKLPEKFLPLQVWSCTISNVIRSGEEELLPVNVKKRLNNHWNGTIHYIWGIIPELYAV